DVDHGVDCALRCLPTTLARKRLPLIFPPLIYSCSNSNGRNMGAFATRMTIAGSTMFQMSMLFMEVGFMRTMAKRVASRATMNNANAKIQHTATFWESVMWRCTIMERGMDIARCKSGD